MRLSPIYFTCNSDVNYKGLVIFRSQSIQDFIKKTYVLGVKPTLINANIFLLREYQLIIPMPMVEHEIVHSADLKR